VAYDDDHGHVAMPKLVGGPKYTRPPVAALSFAERPPDPDDFPLTSEWTPEDHALAQELGLDAPRPNALGSAVRAGAAMSAQPTPATDGHAARPNGRWSMSGGTMGADARPRHRGFGLFRGRSGRSGIG
jgi:hypothetical protein